MPVELPSTWVSPGDLPSSLGTQPGAQTAIDGALATVRAETRQQLLLGQTTVTLELTYDEWGRTCVVLPQRPVVSVDSVTIVDAPQVAWKVEPARPNVLLLAYNPRAVPLVTLFGALRVQPSVTVTYTAGYDPNTASGAASLAIAKSVLLAVATRLLSNPQGLLEERIDDYAYKAGAAGTALLAGEQAALSVYSGSASSVRAR